MSQDQAVTIYVTYEGISDARFDRRYYVDAHLPLVMRAWSQYGLVSVEAFFPPVARTGTLAICECQFRNADAVNAAFDSPEATDVMADVASFTDIAPRRVRATPI
jgi:uncharacterized protein (TIGR02118 family)